MPAGQVREGELWRGGSSPDKKAPVFPGLLRMGVSGYRGVGGKFRIPDYAFRIQEYVIL